MRAHNFIRTGDHDAFRQIQDRNGEVVLSYCRACECGEGELGPNCLGRPALTADTISEEQLRGLQAWAINADEAAVAWAAMHGVISDRRLARQRCADILNARAEAEALAANERTF